MGILAFALTAELCTGVLGYEMSTVQVRGLDDFLPKARAPVHRQLLNTVNELHFLHVALPISATIGCNNSGGYKFPSQISTADIESSYSESLKFQLPEVPGVEGS